MSARQALLLLRPHALAKQEKKTFMVPMLCVVEAKNIDEANNKAYNLKPNPPIKDCQLLLDEDLPTVEIDFDPNKNQEPPYTMVGQIPGINGKISPPSKQA